MEKKTLIEKNFCLMNIRYSYSEQIPDPTFLEAEYDANHSGTPGSSNLMVHTGTQETVAFKRVDMVPVTNNRTISG